MTLAAMAASEGVVGQRIESARETVRWFFQKQADRLSEARKAHSHSDVIFPPDLAIELLGPAAQNLRSHISQLLVDHGTLDDLVKKDVIPLLAREWVFAELNQVASTSSGKLNEVADERALFDRLDVTLAMELEDLMDNGIPLLMHEEILERLTIEACSSHFAYIESRIDLLTRGLVPSKGKGLVLLRICNELVRRLSKPTRTHTIFAGRVLTLLSRVLPLGERSGVNFRGDFNVENTTIIDVLSPKQPAESETEGTTLHDEDDESDSQKGRKADLSKEERKAIEAKAQRLKDEKLFQSATQDVRAYAAFWSAQRWFSDPLLLTSVAEEDDTPASDLPSRFVDPISDGNQTKTMVRFRTVTFFIFSLLGAVSRLEKELAGTQTKGARKRKSSDVAEDESKSLPDAGEQLGSSNNHRASEANDEITEHTTDDSFFPKYLTNRSLFEYELRDAIFRRHIIVQYLVLFQFLLTFAPKHREQMDASKNKSLSNAIYSSAFVLDDADEQWVRSSWREAINTLQAIPPEGKRYVDTILLILQRETNWLRWKSEDCPPIDVTPIDGDRLAAYVRARKAFKTPLRRYPHAVGTAALSRLWEDGVRRPEPGSRTMENADGMEVQVKTDGLDDLEMGPMIPTLETYAAQIEELEQKSKKRREDLGWDPARPFVIGGMQTTAEMRKSERQRIAREDKDAATSQWEQQRSVAAWKAMRMARTKYIDCFAKMRCDLPEGGSAIGARIDDVGRLMQAVSDKANGIPALPTPAPSKPTRSPSPVATAEETREPVTETDNVRSENVVEGKAESPNEKVSDEAAVKQDDENVHELPTEGEESPPYEPQDTEIVSARSSFAVPNEGGGAHDADVEMAKEAAEGTQDKEEDVDVDMEADES